ncbi:urease accessory protein UreE [Psychromarinibacter sp. C21-152]|uniref:Urease accessory protein UreE n=1 Tax=Psychromarinibacter sediminicola TaxID=3033385 RepID=A0AAE3NXB6_9RHOB|nr:urease accessory protein UreE [Psychromarinibacter sediminicola]MDF0603691.1 urease accessory protein UreE [Psychromarinibacter sediminicola]
MSAALPRATEIRRAPLEAAAADRVVLTYDGRLLRRRKLQAAGGMAFLADLAATVSLDHGDAFVLEDGRLIAVEAAPEALLQVTGDLPRLAWHIGNRHTPCRIEPGRLLIQRDHVLAQMLEGLGAEVAEVTEPFTPEGGAYGHGRTMGHDHGPVHHHSAHTHIDDDEDGDDDGEALA